MAISDLPGYIQGYKFTDSAAFYDSTNKYFIDQAGYSDFPASRLTITTGTPSFVDVNSARGMTLDNTVQGVLYPPVDWHGSVIVVAGAPGTYSTNGNMYYLIGGAAAGVTSNAYLNYLRSGAHFMRSAAAAAVTNATMTPGSDAIKAYCFSGDQENRIMYGLLADGTLVTGATVGDNNLGVEMFHDTGTEDATYGQGMRFGNLSGTKGNSDALASGDSMIICELHFFKGILTAGDTTDVETELTALETTYG